MGGFGTSWGEGGNALPTEDQARAVLSGWARRTRLVPDTLFDGPLAVGDASVVWMKVERLVETRAEAPATVPGTLGQHETYEDLRTHRLEGSEWRELDWHGVRRGSVTTDDCPTCRGRVAVACPACGGRALVRCPKTQTCGSCGGSGRFPTRQGPPEHCSTCRGLKKVSCELCEGIGWRPCTDCDGGRVACAACGATGCYTSYQAGRIQRAIDRTTVHAGAGKAAAQKVGLGLYRPMFAGDQPLDVSALPAQVAGELMVELARRVPGERWRKVESLVLPVVAVSYQDAGRSRTAYLVGSERRVVHAPGARRLRWPFRWLR